MVCAKHVLSHLHYAHAFGGAGACELQLIARDDVPVGCPVGALAERPLDGDEHVGAARAHRHRQGRQVDGESALARRSEVAQLC